MKKKYDFLQSKRNPYAKALKTQITIRLDGETVQYFKRLSGEAGLPYQSLMNLYLKDCAAHHRKLHLGWTAVQFPGRLLPVPVLFQGQVAQFLVPLGSSGDTYINSSPVLAIFDQPAGFGLLFRLIHPESRQKLTSIYFEPSLVAKLREKARRRGMGYQSLLKLIAYEHLNEY